VQGRRPPSVSVLTPSTPAAFVTGQERQAHAIRAKDPLGRHGVGFTDERREHRGQGWQVDKREIRGPKWEILVGVVKEKRQILIALRRRKSGVGSKFEVEIEMNGRV
jgi:hypothetical protein